MADSCLLDRGRVHGQPGSDPANCLQSRGFGNFPFMPDPCPRAPVQVLAVCAVLIRFGSEVSVWAREFGGRAQSGFGSSQGLKVSISVTSLFPRMLALGQHLRHDLARDV
jgi:hypothetical protein